MKTFDFLKGIRCFSACALLILSAACCGSGADDYDLEFHNTVDSLFQNGKVAEAMEMLDARIADNADDIDSRFIRSQINCCLKRYENAMEDIETAISLYKGRKPANLSRMYGTKGDICYEIKDYEAAVEAYEIAMKNAADNGTETKNRKVRLAASCYNLGLYGRSEELLDEVLEEYPDDALANIGMAMCCIKSGDYEEGLDYLGKAEAVDSSNTDIYLFKAEALKYLGCDEEALAALREAFEKGFRSFEYLEEYAFQGIPGYEDLVNGYKEKDAE